MAATSMVTVEHQHGVSKLPLFAGAQSFDSPQTGHTRFGLGNMETELTARRSVVIRSFLCLAATVKQARRLQPFDPRMEAIGGTRPPKIICVAKQRSVRS